MLAVLEVYIILRLMGVGFTVSGAFIVEGLTKVINLVGALNPGNFILLCTRTNDLRIDTGVTR